MNLESIKPFNELYYKNCLYNSLFSIIKFYKRSINPLFSYDLFYYDVSIKNSDNSLYNIVSILETKKPEDIVVNDIGLQFNKVVQANNIVVRINNAVKSNVPSIIWVDAFYLPYRNDTYKRRHLPHALLVYGVSPCMKYYKIIDHDKFETLTYEKRSLAVDELSIAYEGYKNNFSDFNLDTFYEIWQGNTKAVSELYCYDTYINNYINKADFIYNSISSIKKLEKYLIEIYSQESLVSLHVENILLKLNFAIELKRAEKFVQQRFNLVDSVIKYLDNSLENLRHSRDILAKYYYSRKYNKENLINSINFSKLEELEKYRVEEIMSNYFSGNIIEQKKIISF
ncbi:MAG: BtrH N-terminal domain-containing protein [Defluviitaleaceae bacterium]|nr:BtrH N-terminal domain-containing protein [Defluviitaleaceae bacterium]